MNTEHSKSFREVSKQKRVGLGREVVEMLMHNKKYWMIPIIVVLALLSALLILGTTSAAPFIYTLF